MIEYRVEFDVPLWQYVLRVNDETIPLNKQEVREANWLALMIMEGRRNQNDSSTGNGNPTHN